MNAARLPARVLGAMIKGYRLLLSPLFGPCCRFHPTCSDYALQALSVHGACKGGWFALRRLLRCHPFSPGGYDPVPPPRAPRATMKHAPRAAMSGSESGDEQQ